MRDRTLLLVLIERMGQIDRLRSPLIARDRAADFKPYLEKAGTLVAIAFPVLA